MEYRGAHVSGYDKTRLNDQGGKLLRDAGIDFGDGKDYDWIMKNTKDNGYAEYYLEKCSNKSKMVNEADQSIYRQLVEIDTALETTAGTQLYACLYHTTRWDIIKVLFFIWNKISKYYILNIF